MKCDERDGLCSFSGFFPYAREKQNNRKVANVRHVRHTGDFLHD